MSHEPKRTNEDYSKSLLSLVQSAHAHGLNTTEDEKLLIYLRHRAEVEAEYVAQVRHLYNILHKDIK